MENMLSVRTAVKLHLGAKQSKRNLATGTMEPFHSLGADDAEQLREWKRTVLIRYASGMVKKIAVLGLIVLARTISQLKVCEKQN